MNKLNIEDQTCVSSLKLLGDYHTLRIIDTLQNGPMRFCSLQRMVDNLNPVTLTDRLKKLETAGLVCREEDEDNAVYYSLTQIGLDAIPVLDAVNNFSNKARLLST